MIPREPSTTLTLPHPAAELWLKGRDIIAAEMPARKGWERYIGGGTILAARWRHRRSTDVDINVPTNRSLRRTGRAISKELNGDLEVDTRDRVVIATDSGKVDINRAPLEPRSGAKQAQIAGRMEHVLSTTQILRGKLRRATRPGPVRDAYDIIRATEDPDSAADLAAAYNLLNDDNKDAVETSWMGANEKLRAEAEMELELTEESRVDWDRIGTTTAQVLKDHRVNRVVLTLKNGRITARRFTQNGSIFLNSWDPRDVAELCLQTGMENVFEDNYLYIDQIAAAITAYQARDYSGVVVDTAETDTIRRIQSMTHPRPAPERPAATPRRQDRFPGRGWGR